MFVYLLIAAELALLYVVFWYLYVREPEHRSHISADMWGGYHQGEEPYVDPYIAFLESQRGELAELKTYAQEERFVWDARANRYIPTSQFEAQGLLARMAAKLDRNLSRLNVKH